MSGRRETPASLLARDYFTWKTNMPRRGNLTSATGGVEAQHERSETARDGDVCLP